MSDNSYVPGVDSTQGANARRANLERLRAQRSEVKLEARQVASERNLIEVGNEALFNPLYLLKKAESLEKRIKRNEQKESETAKEDKDVADIDAVTKTAEEYIDRNPEMNQQALLSLRKLLNDLEDPEAILQKMLESYPDHYLADEALDFMERTSDPETKVGKAIRQARGLLNDRYGREVRAGRNINNDAKEYAKEGLGSTGALRDLYRDVTGNPREPTSLFEELNESFTFGKMKPILSFLLHSIGSDLKSKGPSIEKAELHRLFSETRTMQAILGIYRFFHSRMALISSLFNKEDLTLPKRLNFELLAKQFVKYVMERYPSPDKILRLAGALGISEEVIAQIIIFSQFRDAIRGVSPKLFKSDKHRQDLLMALIETISELDDLLEEEDEDEDEEEEEETKKGYSEKDTIS